MTTESEVDIRVERVTDKKSLRQFIQVPRRIYKDDPAWVAPLMFERMGVLDKKQNPYFDHARAEYWIAWRGDTPVGRISVWTVARGFDGVQPWMPLTRFRREIGEERRTHGGNIL